jgi:peptidyl-prolyl cis-trans isomerase A (cyclophilin A)
LDLQTIRDCCILNLEQILVFLNDEMNKMKSLLHCFSLLLIISCSNKQQSGHVEIITRMGDIEVELYPDKAPKTVTAFLKNIDEHVYDQSSFYRVLKIEGADAMSNAGIIQGGIWKSHPDRIASLQNIPHESTALTGLSHIDGMLSIARLEAGSAKAEFFICIGDQSTFDAGRKGSADGLGYAAFGKVVKGMSVVRKIQEQAELSNAFGDVNNPPVIIDRIVRY